MSLPPTAMDSAALRAHLLRRHFPLVRALPLLFLLAAVPSHALPVPCSGLGENEIWSNRLPPSPPGYMCPYACLPKVTALRDQWMADDTRGWERIANEYCSHRNGWVENNPGTCNAGGPPPICVADHWHQEPRAMDKWLLLMCRLRQDRYERVKSTVCGCISDEMLALRKKAAPPARALPAGAGQGPKGALCSTDSNCPPGMKCDPAFKRCGFPGRIQAAPPSVSEQDLARTLVNYDSGALIQMINNTVTLAERLECSETVIIGSTFTAFAVAERHNYAAALSALQHDIHNTQLVLKDFLAQAEWAAKGNKPSRGMDAYNAKLTMWLGRIAASHPVTRQEYTLVMSETGSRNSCLTSTSTGQGELDWLVERLLHTPLTSYADTTAMPAKGTAE